MVYVVDSDTKANGSNFKSISLVICKWCRKEKKEHPSLAHYCVTPFSAVRLQCDLKIMKVLLHRLGTTFNDNATDCIFIYLHGFFFIQLYIQLNFRWISYKILLWKCISIKFYLIISSMNRTIRMWSFSCLQSLGNDF